jgi:hypothetical protein
MEVVPEMRQIWHNMVTGHEEVHVLPTTDEEAVQFDNAMRKVLEAWLGKPEDQP